MGCLLPLLPLLPLPPASRHLPLLPLVPDRLQLRPERRDLRLCLGESRRQRLGVAQTANRRLGRLASRETRVDRLVALRLVDCRLGTRADGAALMGLLQTGRALKELDLSENAFRSDTVADVFRGLANNTTLEHMVLDENMLHTVHDEAWIGLFSTALHPRSALVSLSMRACSLGDFLVSELANALFENGSVRVLNLGSNYVSRSSAELLLQSLAPNRALTPPRSLTPPRRTIRRRLGSEQRLLPLRPRRRRRAAAAAPVAAAASPPPPSPPSWPPPWPPQGLSGGAAAAAAAPPPPRRAPAALLGTPRARGRRRTSRAGRSRG